MKNKLLKLLVLVLTLCMLLLFSAACKGVYETTQVDDLIAGLQTTIDNNKKEQDQKIADIFKEYQEKDSELLAAIESDIKALDDLKEEYDATLQILLNELYSLSGEIDDLDDNHFKKIKMIQDDIAKLSSNCEMEVAKLQENIDKANKQIEDNKKDFDAEILGIQTLYDLKLAEINGIIEMLENTDSTQQEVIIALVNRVTELENVQIENVVLSERGDITIYFTDGTCKTFENPGCKHDFGVWTAFMGQDEVSCEEKLYYRICANCNGIEWRNGEENDHAWERKYSNSEHWFSCIHCNAKKEQEGHLDNGEGVCGVCNSMIWTTDGVVYEISDGVASVVGYEGNDENVRIMDSYMGVPVTEVFGFSYEFSIKNLILPNSVKKIGDFNNCYSLENIILGENITEFGLNVFSESDKIKYNVKDGLKYLNGGNNQFFYLVGVDNNYITNANIDENCKVIAFGALAICENLSKVEIPNGVKRIDACAFQGTSLTKVTIPGSVESMGHAIFLDCDKLLEVDICEGISNIEKATFDNCRSLSSIKIPQSVTSIGSNAFRFCSTLNNIVIPNSVKNIDQGAFYACDSLSNIIFESGSQLEIIDKKSFYECVSLIDIKLPSSVIIIEERAFEYCSNLTTVIFDKNCEITSIGDYVFDGCSSLKYIEIPSNVKNIGDSAFNGCTSLISVSISSDLTIVGFGAFDYCDSLETIYYGGSAEDWAGITIDRYNTNLINATRYYYVEKQEDLPADGGNYWHYIDGVPTKWE